MEELINLKINNMPISVKKGTKIFASSSNASYRYSSFMLSP